MIYDAAQAVGASRRRRLDETDDFVIIDRTLRTTETEEIFDGFEVRTVDEFEMYVGASVDIGIFSGFDASATASGAFTRTVTFAYSDSDTLDFEYSDVIWSGPVITRVSQFSASLSSCASNLD